MERIKGNTMTVDHFRDYYYMEAMVAGLTMAKVANAELEYKHSFVRLENDITEEYNRLTKSIALRVYVYLWAAALGEARHADNRCDTRILDLDGRSRSSIFSESLRYFPDDENVQIVLDIFHDENWWNSGCYGGKKWYEIVEAMALYGKVSDSAFIDHTVDLEHNGGCVFTKGEGAKSLKFSIDGYSGLHYFLDYKFREDILNSPKRQWGLIQKIEVSTKVYNLVSRYSHIIGCKAMDWLKPELETLTDYSVEWDFDRLETEEQSGSNTCMNCGDHVSYDEVCMHDDDVYCDSCFCEKFTSCAKCGDELRNEYAIALNGDDYCEHCAVHKMNAVKCTDCEEWGVIDDMRCLEDSGNWYCDYHYSKNVEWECSECGCGHEYSETETCENCGHPQHEEEEEEESDYELFEDSDGVLDNQKTDSDTRIEVRTFVTLPKHTTVTTETWPINDYLFVYNIADTERQSGNKKYSKHDVQYAIYHVPTKLYIDPHTKTDLETTIKKASQIKDMIDWNFKKVSELTSEQKAQITSIMGY